MSRRAALWIARDRGVYDNGRQRNALGTTVRPAPEHRLATILRIKVKPQQPERVPSNGNAR